MARGRSRQIEMTFPKRGGARPGAGRKPGPGRRRASHKTRPRLASRFPVHVTTRICDGLPSLRKRKVCKAIRRALLRVMDEPGFRVCEFSVQRDHVHLVCEAKNSDCLARGIKRLKQIAARAINAGLTQDGRPRRRTSSERARTGSVFSDRYHMTILRTPRQVRNTLCYVLHNGRKHRARWPALDNGVTDIDPFTSAWWFDGWKDENWKRGLAPPHDGEACVSPAGTWLLSTGWRRRGLIGIDERPAGDRPAWQSR